MNKKPLLTFICCICLIPSLLLDACGTADSSAGIPKQSEYGVFLSVTENLQQLDSYKTIVIDAQYFTAEEIQDFRNGGHKVYSYINVGALEDFRDYYDEYKDLALGKYEHWDEEVWINVADHRWQDFILKKLGREISDKGIDGFFVDNCDVYFNYPKDEILDGLAVMMKGLVGTGKEVIINGGDCFLDAYCSEGSEYGESVVGGQWRDVITGINQETVYSRILWDGDKFSSKPSAWHV